MSNSDFLTAVFNSFKLYIESGTSRSTKKLYPLHGFIASDLAARLGEGYTVHSVGYGDNKEASVPGRYFDKMVDITVKDRDGKAVCGIGVKFVMQNYSQNSNNYFENMLGETANVRCTGCLYYQIFVILERLPYYDNKKQIRRWEAFTAHNAAKYVKLSADNVDILMHSPDKTLICVVSLPHKDGIRTLADYRKFHSKTSRVEIGTAESEQFEAAVILNDYAKFMDKVYHKIMSL